MDRREFLQKTALTGLAGAGIALTSGFNFPSHRHHDRDNRKHRRRTKPSAGDGRCAWGAYVNPEGKTAREAIVSFEGMIGRRLEITRHYTHWDMGLPGGTIEWSAEAGRTPLVDWASDKLNGQCVPWAEIARGGQDRWIRQQARSIAAAGFPMYFTFHHEPEDEPEAGGPAQFRAAFARIKNLFDDEGAHNLTWLVTLMAGTYAGGHGGPKAWAPPDYDLVGVDGYNRHPIQPNVPWRSFREIFGPAHQFAVANGKRLAVEEVGSVEQDARGHRGDPGAKGKWFKDMAKTIKAWGNVALVEYSHTVGNYGGRPMPYWVDTRSSSLRAYREVAVDAYFD